MSKKNEMLECLYELKEYGVKGFSVGIREIFPYVWEDKCYFILLAESIGVVSGKRKKTFEVYSTEDHRVLCPEEPSVVAIKAQLPEISEETAGDITGSFKEKRELDRDLERVLDETMDKIRWGEAEKAEWRAYLRKSGPLRHESSRNLYAFFEERL